MTDINDNQLEETDKPSGENEISETDTGSTVTFQESATERDERIRSAANEASKRI